MRAKKMADSYNHPMVLPIFQQPSLCQAFHHHQHAALEDQVEQVEITGSQRRRLRHLGRNAPLVGATDAQVNGPHFLGFDRGQVDLGFGKDDDKPAAPPPAQG